MLSAEFGLHPLAVEDAVHEHHWPKLDRYRSHLFLAAYAVHLDETTCTLATSELAAFITTVLATNLTIQSNRMNVNTKKVTSWAAIIAVPTFVTGFYGMNVAYPGFGHLSGLAASAIIMITAAALYLIFKRHDWL